MRELAGSEAEPCTVLIDRIAHAPNLHFPRTMQARIGDAARALGIPAMELPSAAGHDARHLNTVCPTGMIFVPCRDGISHAEDESCRPEDVTAGARVLAHVLADLADQPPTDPSGQASKGSTK